MQLIGLDTAWLSGGDGEAGELLVTEDAYPPFVIGTVGRGRLGDGVMLTARRPQGRVQSRKFDLERAAAGA